MSFTAVFKNPQKVSKRFANIKRVLVKPRLSARSRARLCSLEGGRRPAEAGSGPGNADAREETGPKAG